VRSSAAVAAAFAQNLYRRLADKGYTGTKDALWQAVRNEEENKNTQTNSAYAFATASGYTGSLNEWTEILGEDAVSMDIGAQSSYVHAVSSCFQGIVQGRVSSAFVNSDLPGVSAAAQPTMSAVSQVSGQNTPPIAVYTTALSAQNRANLFTVSDGSGRKGEQVTVNLLLHGQVRLCGFEMKLKYDNSVLVLLSVVNTRDLNVISNGKTTPGTVFLNYAGVADIQREAEILQLTFQIRDTTSAKKTEIQPEATDVFRLDSTDEPIAAPYALQKGIITIL
jgi:hypothetical protein